MKLAWCGLLLILGCNKTGSTSEPAAAPTGSAGSAASAGSAPAAAAPTPGSAATAAPAPAPASKQAAALDELDRWLAPVGKLAPRAQMDFMCAAIPTLRDKSTALTAMDPPTGADAAGWKAACESLHGSLESVGLCCNSYGFYDKPPKPHGDEDAWTDCMKDYPNAFAAVAKLVPGARPLGVHAGEPLMTPPKQ